MPRDHDPHQESVELLRKDYESLMRVIHELHSCRTLRSFPEVVTRALVSLIPCNLAAYNEVNVPLGRIVAYELPPMAGIGPLLEKWQHHMGEHPILNYYRSTGDGQALTISDFLSEEQYHALNIYRECFAPLKAEDQLAVGFFLGDSVVVGLAFNRHERGFSGRDRQLLNLVRPHVIQAYAAAREFDALRSERQLLQAALGSIGHGVLRYDEKGRLVECSPEAVAVLGGGNAKGLGQLSWLQEERAAFLGATESTRLSHVPEAPHVTVRWQRAGERVIGIVSERPLGSLAKRFGLTAREGEVLRWLAEGKSNAEIGEILGIAPGTVKIHVQRILAKLGAPNRAAAVAMLRTE